MGQLTPGAPIPVGTSIGEVPQAQPERTQFVPAGFEAWRNAADTDSPARVDFDSQVNIGFVLCEVDADTWEPQNASAVEADETQTYCASCYVNTTLQTGSPSSSSTLRIYEFGTPATVYAFLTFNPANGVVIATGGTRAITSVRSESVLATAQDGTSIPLRRISFTFALNQGEEPQVQFINNNNNVVAGGFQLEDADGVSDYIIPAPAIGSLTLTTKRPFGHISSYLVQGVGGYARYGRGTFTFIFPGNVRQFYVSGCGAGGAGGTPPAAANSAGSGGGAGACMYRCLLQTPSLLWPEGTTELSIEVGEGDVAVAGTATTFNGNNGGDTVTMNGGALGAQLNADINIGAAGGTTNLLIAPGENFVLSQDGGASDPGLVIAQPGAVLTTGNPPIYTQGTNNRFLIMTNGSAAPAWDSAVGATGNVRFGSDTGLQLGTFVYSGGRGGSNFFGQGGRGSIRADSLGTQNASRGTGPGAGGGGGQDSDRNSDGAAGNDGFLLIEW